MGGDGAAGRPPPYTGEGEEAEAGRLRARGPHAWRRRGHWRCSGTPAPARAPHPGPAKGPRRPALATC